MVEALNHGKAFVNASSLYAESAAESMDTETLFSGINISIPHPTDSHPTISQRMENLGHSMDEFKGDSTILEPSDSAIDLLKNPTEIEEEITNFEHQVLLALGLAKLPEESSGAAIQETES